MVVREKLTIDVDVENIPEEYRIKQPDAVNGDKLREYLKKRMVLKVRMVHLIVNGVI